MRSWKALGPDGYQPGFFKKTWKITGQNVCNFVIKMLNYGNVIEEDAEVLPVLVPKEAKPPSLKSFHPISLYNVRMKLVS